MDSISIIITNFNYANFLPKAIESALSQGDGVEVIVVDDGSTDQSRDVLTDLEKKHDNLCVILQDNTGPAAARNRGAKKAAGEWLCFLDADDVLIEGVFKGVFKALPDDFQIDVIVGEYNPSTKTSTKLLYPIKEGFKQFIRKKLAMAQGAYLIKKALFDQIQFPEHIKGREDVVFFARVLACGHCVKSSKQFCELYKHTDSFRHRMQEHNQNLLIVPEIFNHESLPQPYHRYENEFKSRLCLSFFRDHFKQGDFKTARSWYYRAIKTDWRRLFQWAYLSKFIRSFFLTAGRIKA
jgi:glycosyltransferase involved in cell wall biosynthesis